MRVLRHGCALFHLGPHPSTVQVLPRAPLLQQAVKTMCRLGSLYACKQRLCQLSNERLETNLIIPNELLRVCMCARPLCKTNV